MSVAELNEVDEVEAVESEVLEEAESRPDQPLSHYERLYLNRIQEMESGCAESEAAYKDAQSKAKDAKLMWEGHVAAMRSFIARGPKGLMQQSLPGMEESDPDPATDDSWKSTPIDAALALTENQKERLEGAGILTVGDFERVRAGGDPDYPRGLIDIKRVGQKAIDTWEEEILNWFDKNRPVLQMQLTEVDAGN